MADAVLLTNYQNFLVELMTRRQITFSAAYALLAELSGVIRAEDGSISFDDINSRFTRSMDVNREVFHGKKLTVPLQISDVPGAAGIAEGATFTAPAPFDSAQATLNLARVVQPIAISLDLERDAKNGSTSAMESIAAYTESAYRSVARAENDMLHGNGDALLVSVASATGSPGLTVPVGTNAPWDQLTPGRVVSVLTRSSGADPGQGKRRKIASVDRVNGNVVFSTAQVASDGGSGNITFSANEGIYIDSSWGNAAQGLGQAVATTGVFEGIDKSAVAQWKGLDATPSGSQALADALFDNALYLLNGNGVGAPDFAVAHPRVLNLYKQTKQSLVRYDPQETTLRSGFKAIVYQSSTSQPFGMLPDINAPRGIVRLVTKEAVQIYGDDRGPSFIDDDGGMWRFFTRAAIKEADLYDRWQLAVRDCGKLCTIGNSTTLLTEAP